MTANDETAWCWTRWRSGIWHRMDVSHPTRSGEARDTLCGCERPAHAISFVGYVGPEKRCKRCETLYAQRRNRHPLLYREWPTTLR